MTTPLEGIRVLELGQLIAGPFCGQLLADFGAEVVKIEPPGSGDAMRQWGRTDADGNTLWWPVIARNKKSLCLDLRREDAQKILRDLVERADILIENFRPGRMEEWGLGFEILKKINPGLIMVRVTGFGQTGPYSDRAGFASVCEAMGGLRHIVGYPDRPPVRLGISLGDTLAGQNAFQGTLLALHHREKTGEGQVVDTSIYESVLSVMENLVTEYDRIGHTRERSGSILPGIAPSNAYPTANGGTVIIGANQDSLFRRLVVVMGQPELANDSRFSSHQARGQHQEILDAIISAWTSTCKTDDLVKRLVDAGVPVGPTYTAQDMLSDPHFKARGSIVRIKDGKLGDIAMQGVFPKLSASPGKIRHTGPKLGEDSEAVLTEWLGYASAYIETLKSSRTI